MVLLRWLSSWFLISKRNIQVHQKDTLDLSIHSSCLKALNDGGRLRRQPLLSREFKFKSPPRLPPPPPPSLARAWGECFHWPTLPFSAPSPTRDWHGGSFPTHGELAQGLSLKMRPTRTASPLCFFSPQWPETWLSPGSCANILVRFEVCFQTFG